MSNLAPATESHSLNMTLNLPPVSLQPSKSQRVLACTLCQQRKVKCDRKFPCANCIKSRSQCVPATLVPRQRRRKITERLLLDRLRKYEDLLRQSNIPFEPLRLAKETDSTNADIDDNSHDEQVKDVTPEGATSSTTEKTESGQETKNVFHIMSQAFRDPDYDSDSSHDDLRETVVKSVWDQEIEYDQNILFGSRAGAVDIFTLHPDPVQIFRLWQVYMDNVNPLLKVTHIPSLQPRVIEAASNLTNIDPTLEALMFSVYCIAVSSLTAEDCQTTFGSSKEDLLSMYQSGCQQALWLSGFLRTSDRDCLTALYLYLISVKSNIVPQTLSSMLGVAIRIAQRMGIHSESNLAKCTAFEAEMRRRLWWSLMLFDTRITRLAGSNTVTLDPTWDCKIPLNVNDTDLRPEMKVPPATRGEPTDALFTVIRSEFGEFIRNTEFHLQFTTPALKHIAKHDLTPGSDHVVKLEELIENRYLKFCDPEIPLHFMAIWTIRADLAKYRLMEYNLRFSSSDTRRVAAQYDVATATAIRTLECDTKVMTSPLTKGFVWSNQINFPFPAYYQTVQDLRRRPTSKQAQQAWNVMSDNWDAWFSIHFGDDSPIFRLFSKILLQAWEAYEAAPKPPGQTLPTPRIVLSIRGTLARMAGSVHSSNTEWTSIAADMGTSELPMSMPMQMPTTFLNHSLPYGMEMQRDYLWMGSGMSSASDVSGQFPQDSPMNQMDWTSLGRWPGW